MHPLLGSGGCAGPVQCLGALRGPLFGQWGFDLLEPQTWLGGLFPSLCLLITNLSPCLLGPGIWLINGFCCHLGVIPGYAQLLFLTVLRDYS